MLLEILNSGRKVQEICDEDGLNSNMLLRWKREYKAKSGDVSKKRFSSEEQELKALRKELREVTLERDILKKEVGIFSKSNWYNMILF